MEKIDFKKQLSNLYGQGTTISTVVVSPMNYLMIDGRGDPNTSPEYVHAIEALYPVAYTLKFMAKKELEQDYGVMPLEGIWWAEDMDRFLEIPKSEWLWTAMIMQPDLIPRTMFERAVGEVAKKKNPTSLPKLRLATYDEGRAAQVLYTGSYSKEGATIQQLHAYITEQGGALTKTTKHHHEIYLSDPRRTAPSKLKTIIRQPY